MRCLLAVLSITWLAHAGTSLAHADEPTGLRQMASAEFELGRAAYAQGRCREAAGHFAQARRLDPLPSLLFDEGEAWRCDFRQTHDAKSGVSALRQLRAYLFDPDGLWENRQLATAQFGELKRALPAGMTFDPPLDLTLPGDPPTAAQLRRRRRALYVGLGVSGVVAVALAVGLGVGLGIDWSNPPRVSPRW